MGKIGILIDSTVYLSEEMIKENDIEVVSLNVVDGVDSYKETEIDNDFVFKLQDEGSSLTTSQPAPGEFLEAYQRMLDKGYDKILCVLLSRNISGTFQSATLAKNMLDDPNKVHLFDTRLCAYGTEMIGVEVVEMVNNNHTAEEIISRIEKIIATSGQLFTVQNLFSLVKGGRLSIAKAAIGTVLRVKPIIEVVNGKLELVKSERTYKKLHNYMLNKVKKQLDGYEKVTFYITNQNSLESGLVLKELIEEEFPGSKITFTSYLGPVFSIHVGKKGYGISFFVE
jgi:DegV family protein with EDD domain